MTEFWQFMGEHWFIAWCLSWAIWGVFWLIGAICNMIFTLINRLIRMVVVCVRGWPPAHLDADGGWKPAPEEKA